MGKYTGTNSGSIEYVEGKKGNAAQFNGSSYIATDYLHKDVDAFSVSVWVKPSTDVLHGDILSNHSNNTNAGIVIKREDGDGKYNAEITCDGNYYDLSKGIANEYGANGIINPTFDKFDHIVTTFDGDNLTMYVNGTLAKTLPVGATAADSPYALYIGTYAGAPMRSLKPFTGLIDEVKVFDGVLSEKEIMELFEE